MAQLTRIVALIASFWLFAPGFAGADIHLAGERRDIVNKRHHGKHQYYHRERSVPKSHAASELPFEVLRMLSVGMSKVEVLSRAGAPHYTLKPYGSSAWVYTSSDKWIVELTFAAGRIIAINWTRP